MGNSFSAPFDVMWPIAQGSTIFPCASVDPLRRYQMVLSGPQTTDTPVSSGAGRGNSLTVPSGVITPTCGAMGAGAMPAAETLNQILPSAPTASERANAFGGGN